MKTLSSINERIAQVVEYSGLTKTAFGERINMSSAFMSQLCSGARAPSERTISDICREFRVNEVWLRTGSGDMLKSLSRREEIAVYMADLLSGERSPLEEAVISAMARLPSDLWPAAARMLDLLLEEYQRTKEEE